MSDPDQAIGGENLDGDVPVTETPEAITEATSRHADSELERTLGLTGGLAIGIGTMIGAGIFVFPGIAANSAGPAASVSFLIGGVIALLVALPASELATAMPRSGGGYYFISRAMGTLAGTIIGLSLWFGLVFATAFYLVGFGYYAVDLLVTAGIPATPELVIPLGIIAGVLFTLLNMTGTENAASLQNGVVALLMSVLATVLLIGGFDAVAGGAAPVAAGSFAPGGYLPILSTAALVFTSYLGFAQVAAVAGEMRNPSRNLPIAMVGSVVIVTVMYVAAIVVLTNQLSPADLEAMANDGMLETAMVEVGRELLGGVGAAAIIFGGLLATMSSANASILSSSRAIYATSRDAIIPSWASRINLQYGTPHVALGLAGGPVLVLTGTGRVEVLAEVASFLHLLMYGLICVSLLVLRRNPPDWYNPSFRVPGGATIPVVGGISSVGLILFMQPISQALGVGFVLLAAGWYAFYARDVRVKGSV